jgi:hypothetical protein
MPRTEHPVDVWQEWTTGDVRDRYAEGNDAFERFNPWLKRIAEHDWRPLRYANSECEKTHKVPEHAFIHLPELTSRNMESHLVHSLQWHDVSAFSRRDMSDHPERYIEVRKIKANELTHETARHAPRDGSIPPVLHYEVLASEHEPTFRKHAFISYKLHKLVAEEVKYAARMVMADLPNPQAFYPSAAAQTGVRQLSEFIRRPPVSLQYLLSGTLAYLDDAYQHPNFRDWAPTFLRDVRWHIDNDLAQHHLTQAHDDPALTMAKHAPP